MADSLGKGDRVIVTGRLEQRSWETQDGEKRSKIEVVADEVGPAACAGRPPARRRPTGATGRAAPGQGGQPVATPAGAAAGPPGAPPVRPGRRARGGGFDSDEEPF